ncbi:CAP domain-containing protein [Leptospira sp. 2 VSF19]|uniref:CAP domain-containing protein n=1 Tax=Leptospira soteropolitanensis TaxID=2950025 RepID=A0AAW5V955_9LEPT|nr:CAP domain-containing protein [Leptospira soteropolitanensis]MCW7491768.1 CAP domain-containing protein [Leptospira soteropolitanensis]MCW7499353.1 CAP domain-containing protein [Leptospira soteropolitanensis]MCW7521056.1 CAP domain-containing protein [Leptospira soteropolitanensis]MCW7525456.1 CAP domain-containing protein [Leptospira soteropolitanensis]MCW7529323.1 CAP domain-containing protein [Leptospira soteropolitanensis]
MNFFAHLKLFRIQWKWLLLFFVLSIFTFACKTPEVKKAPVVEVKKPEPVEKVVEAQDPNLAFLESIEDGRELPDSDKWKVEQYDAFTEETFPSYAPANANIDFSKVDYPLLNAAIFYVTSKERKSLGLRPFKYSEKCEQAAFGHAQDMVTYDFFSHTSTVNGKETLRDRLDLVGISDTYSAENIISSFGIQYQGGRAVFTPMQNGGPFFSYTKAGTPIPNHTYLSLAKSVVETWFNSPSHRKNILNPEFTYMGAGTFFYKDKKFYDIDKVKAVQVFTAKP